MKIKNFIMPTVLCSALATFVPLTVTSCGQSTVATGYTVDRNTDCIYGINKSGQKFKLSDDQLKELEGGFLVGQESGDFVYTKGGVGSDGKEYPTTVNGFIEKAMKEHYLRIELFLINGTYDLKSVSVPENPSHPIVSLNGIVGYDGKLLSVLNCDPGTTASGAADLGNVAQLNLRSLEIEGRDTLREGPSSTAWAVSGIGQLSVSYSCLHGSVSFDADIARFNYSWFDSSNVVLSNDNKTDYALCLRDTLYAYFTDCCFWSRGKAVKVYLPLDDLGADTKVDTWYQLVNCSFWIVGEIPQNGTNPAAADQNKFCVDIYNAEAETAHFDDGDYKMHFRYSGIYGDYDPEEKGVHPDTDPDTYKHFHGGVFGSIDASQFNEQYLDAQELL